MNGYTLTRSRRKTVSLRIQKDLSIEVRAPLRMPRGEIDRFVHQHEDWIRRHRIRMAGEVADRAAFHYGDGQRIPFRGGELTLATGSGRSVCMEGGQLLLPPRCDRAKAVAEFLREQARAVMTQRVEHYAKLMDVRPTGIRITSATTRWGSCSGRNSLCFSWRVACLPEELQDYLAVHELAHIREHNHSPRFWAVVAWAMPDWPGRRAALKVFQSKILF